jgi:FkbM family methyltransferase
MTKLRVDIGLSHNAPISFYWLSNIKDIIVHGYEPNIENIKKIKSSRLYEIYKNKFCIYEYGLSDFEGQSDFYITLGDSGCSSLYVPNENLEYEYYKSVAQIKNANIIFDNLKNETIELLKIDTQGSDFKIIKAIENNLDKVVFLDVEINADKYVLDHDYQRNKLISYLETKNFILLDRSFENGRFMNKKYTSEISKNIFNNKTINGFLDY